MSTKRDVKKSRLRALHVLDEYPEMTFAQIAERTGISRMHLYRLAVRFSDVKHAYVGALSTKQFEAEVCSLDEISDLPFSYKRAYAAAQKALRYQYYLSRWENKPVIHFKVVSLR